MQKFNTKGSSGWWWLLVEWKVGFREHINTKRKSGKTSKLPLKNKNFKSTNSCILRYPALTFVSFFITQSTSTSQATSFQRKKGIFYYYFKGSCNKSRCLYLYKWTQLSGFPSSHFHSLQSFVHQIKEKTKMAWHIIRKIKGLFLKWWSRVRATMQANQIWNFFQKFQPRKENTRL